MAARASTSPSIATGDSHGWAAFSTSACVTSTFVGPSIPTMLRSSSLMVILALTRGRRARYPRSQTAAAVTARIDPPHMLKSNFESHVKQHQGNKNSSQWVEYVSAHPPECKSVRRAGGNCLRTQHPPVIIWNLILNVPFLTLFL